MSLARQIVDFAIKAGSSDIHLEEGTPIAIRVNSDIRILENILQEEDMSKLLLELVGEENFNSFKQLVTLTHQLDLRGSHGYESTPTSPTNGGASPFGSFRIASHAGKT